MSFVGKIAPTIAPKKSQRDHWRNRSHLSYCTKKFQNCTVEGRRTLPGVPHVPGVPCVPRVPCVLGVPGVPGVLGVPGVPGVLGVPGVPGVLGVPGVPGVLGVPGVPGVLGPLCLASLASWAPCGAIPRNSCGINCVILDDPMVLVDHLFLVRGLQMG